MTKSKIDDGMACRTVFLYFCFVEIFEIFNSIRLVEWLHFSLKNSDSILKNVIKTSLSNANTANELIKVGFQFSQTKELQEI